MALLTKTGYRGLTLLTEHWLSRSGVTDKNWLSRSDVIDRTLVIGSGVIDRTLVIGGTLLTEHWLSRSDVIDRTLVIGSTAYRLEGLATAEPSSTYFPPISWISVFPFFLSLLIL